MSPLSTECFPVQAAPPEPTTGPDRTVTLRLTKNGQRVELLGPAGEVQVEIVLTADGPVIRLKGARLELAATDSVAVDCRRFEVRASEEAIVQSGGGVHITGEEVRVRTRDDIHMDGAYIRLNCDETARAVPLVADDDRAERRGETD